MNFQQSGHVCRFSSACLPKIGGPVQLQMLQSHLDELENEQMLAEKRKVASVTGTEPS